MTNTERHKRKLPGAGSGKTKAVGYIDAVSLEVLNGRL